METLTWKEVEEQKKNGRNKFTNIKICSDVEVESLDLIESTNFIDCVINIKFITHIDNCIFSNCVIECMYDCKITNSLFDDCSMKSTIVNNLFFYTSKFLCCNFKYSEFIYTYFYNCDFCSSNFYRAEIQNTKFIDIKTNEGTTFLNLSCPEEGSFIAYKKVNNHLIKLLIPSDAKRSSATTLKCRCSYAKVLEITNLSTNENVDSILNTNTYSDTLYKVNEFVYPDSWDDNRWNECSHGIHFFMNKNNAINY